jgi:hypothetical protein
VGLYAGKEEARKADQLQHAGFREKGRDGMTTKDTSPLEIALEQIGMNSVDENGVKAIKLL